MVVPALRINIAEAAEDSPLRMFKIWQPQDVLWLLAVFPGFQFPSHDGDLRSSHDALLRQGEESEKVRVADDPG